MKYKIIDNRKNFNIILNFENKFKNILWSFFGPIEIAIGLIVSENYNFLLNQYGYCDKYKKYKYLMYFFKNKKVIRMYLNRKLKLKDLIKNADKIYDVAWYLKLDILIFIKRVSKKEANALMKNVLNYERL